MKNLILSFIFVWYFGLRIAEGTPDVFINIVSGPYKTSSACEAAFLTTRAMFGEEGVTYAQCKEMKLEGWGI